VLSELRVSELGVIDDLSLVLGPGMTALTGETGAGKTLVVEAVELLIGGRADPMLVRPGAREAVVEGRFVPRAPENPEMAEKKEEAEDLAEGGGETVLSRVVPADGRSRAYIDGRMATVAALAERGLGLVDLHGQHAHQSLLTAGAQRDALDAFAGTDRGPRDAARARARQLVEALAATGGDGEARQRERELLAYQISELDGAGVQGATEDEDLALEEDRLGQATAHRSAAQSAHEALAGEDQVLDRLGMLIAELGGRPPLAALYERLRGLSLELADAAAEARDAADTLQEDPERLAQVVARRSVLKELRRKYAGPGGDLEAVLRYHAEATRRLAQLEGAEARAEQLALELEVAQGELRQAAGQLGAARRRAAGPFARAVEHELRQLAMPRARFEVRVGPGEEDGASTEEPEAPGGDDLRRLAGEDVTFLLAANPGEPLLPLAKVASGGELARAMLALRLVLLGSGKDDGNGPETLVFDEVDAGIGGEAALAVGRALAELGRRYQVLVVTHLAQVAAYAGAQVAVTKGEHQGRTISRASTVRGSDRVVELSRMLSGQPDSATARRHAAELLRTAAAAAGQERSATLGPS
jgi:DNA repair protein RecN (Recombination protein N)